MTNQRRRSPWWYSVVLGFLVGAVAVIFFLDLGIWNAVAAFIAIVLVILMGLLRRHGADQRSHVRTNVKATITAGLIIALLVIGVALLAWNLARMQGMTWAAWVGGAVIFGLVTMAGRFEDRSS